MMEIQKYTQDDDDDVDKLDKRAQDVDVLKLVVA